jgi:hypothetical protein
VGPEIGRRAVGRQEECYGGPAGTARGGWPCALESLGKNPPSGRICPRFQYWERGRRGKNSQALKGRERRLFWLGRKTAPPTLSDGALHRVGYRRPKVGVSSENQTALGYARAEEDFEAGGESR